MYNQRKRKIIILIFAIIIVLVLLAGGGYFVYAKTDLLKSNKTVFFKYALQTIDSIKLNENKQLTDILELKETIPYKDEVQLVMGNENSKNTKLVMNSIANKPEKQQYSKYDLFFDSQNIFNVEYAKSNNIYALKSDEIVNAFLGIENQNLKVLAQKMGIKDTTGIPDSINENNYNFYDLLKMSEEEKLHIQETYSEVIKNAIKDSNFSKEKNFAVARDGVNYNTTAYRLTLSASETKQIPISVLETLKEDSITLNLIATKAAQIGLDENYTNVNNLTKIIEKEIENINKDEKYNVALTIMIYVDGGKVITTEIIYNNEQKYTIYGIKGENTNSRYLLIENLNTNASFDKINIKQSETIAAENSNYNIEIKYDDNIKYNVNINVKGSKALKNYNIDGTILVSSKEHSLEGNYTEKITFDSDIAKNIIKLDRTNCGVLNDYTTEQLQYLMQAVAQRTNEVINQKVQIISEFFSTIIEDRELTNNANTARQINLNEQNQIQETIQNTITSEETLNSLSEQEVKSFNAKFEAYQGQKSGAQLKALRTTIENSNLTDMENQVTLYIDGERSFSDNIKIDLEATYTIQMQYESDTGFITVINATMN